MQRLKDPSSAKQIRMPSVAREMVSASQTFPSTKQLARSGKCLPVVNEMQVEAEKTGRLSPTAKLEWKRISRGICPDEDG